jgi:hypothetical protein
MKEKREFHWLRHKGYLHITNQIDVHTRKDEIVSKVTNPNFVSRYAFFPLIHTNIIERKFKKLEHDRTKRSHCYMNEGVPKKSAKIRPLHYATHLDAIIFGYYAEKLQEAYECHISDHSVLKGCIIAYRRIPIGEKEKNKSTIHFAKEVFDQIKKRASEDGECVVLTFDIRSFFSTIDHDQLKTAWQNILDKDRLPPDHYTVFKAATHFSYIYLDDLRVKEYHTRRRSGFNEKELARLRNKHGINAFFESPRAFREKVKSGEVRLYKFPFREKETKKPVGIPQGLPISSTLANLYLLDFDKKIVGKIVDEMKGFYCRYSDDIVVLCTNEQANLLEDFVKSTLKESKVEISPNKTEKFIFKNIVGKLCQDRLTAIKIIDGKEFIGCPLNYLGFEFNGQKALIKSANLAKFYRRMIYSVKRKAKRAIKLAEETPGKKPVIFRRQLHKLYTTKPLHNTKTRGRWKKLVQIGNGEFRLRSGEKKRPLRSNYLTYVVRASEIMQEDAIKNQLKKHKAIFNSAIQRHLKSKKR